MENLRSPLMYVLSFAVVMTAAAARPAVATAQDVSPTIEAPPEAAASDREPFTRGLGALTRPDARSGRGRSSAPSEIKARALEAGIEVLTPQRPRDEDFQARLSEQAVDAAPVLVLDMYEHAYQMDYGADAGKYVDNFMQSIRWTTPERLYREAIRV